MTDAVIAKRTDDGAADTNEIRRLAVAAGYEVVAELTQNRRADPTTEFGRGKAEELAATVAETGADAVIFDNELTPTQTVALADRCGTRVLDRYRLVLDIFDAGTGSRRAALQVERAKLEWELPRIREDGDEQALNRYTESGTRYYDVRDRLDELTRKLDDLGDETEARRRRRREEGFAFVALVGYTNAGKSTLLHRLADDLDFAAREPAHDDLDATAEIEDRLFETLETTTRRATVDGRPTLVTDTVGFLDDLPHELVESFHGTLSATANADCALLVADAADPSAEFRRKLRTGLDLLADEDGGILPVLNKADRCTPGELDARRRAVADEAAAAGVEFAAGPVAVSATEGRNLDSLRGRIADALPDHREAELVVPNCGEAMSLVSWLYDRASVETVDYRGEEVRVAVAGPEPVVERAEARAASLD